MLSIIYLTVLDTIMHYMQCLTTRVRLTHIAVWSHVRKGSIVLVDKLKIRPIQKKFSPLEIVFLRNGIVNIISDYI